MKTVILCFIFILTCNLSFAKDNKRQMSATELSQICAEAYNAKNSTFDSNLSAQCLGYISGFLDSVIIIENFAKEKSFCLSRSLPKSQASLILKSWIAQNREIASKTTGSVALYAALKTNFPCKETE